MANQHSPSMRFENNPELYNALNTYRLSKGWTWKRFFLMGVGEAMAQEGDNTDLVLMIANYLNKGR